MTLAIVVLFFCLCHMKHVAGTNSNCKGIRNYSIIINFRLQMLFELNKEFDESNNN